VVPYFAVFLVVGPEAADDIVIETHLLFEVANMALDLLLLELPRLFLHRVHERLFEVDRGQIVLGVRFGAHHTVVIRFGLIQSAQRVIVGFGEHLAGGDGFEFVHFQSTFSERFVENVNAGIVDGFVVIPFVSHHHHPGIHEHHQPPVVACEHHLGQILVKSVRHRLCRFVQNGVQRVLIGNGSVSRASIWMVMVPMTVIFGAEQFRHHLFKMRLPRGSFHIDVIADDALDPPVGGVKGLLNHQICDRVVDGVSKDEGIQHPNLFVNERIVLLRR